MTNWRELLAGALIAGAMAIVGWTLHETVDHSERLEVIDAKLEVMDGKLDAVLAAVQGQEDRLRQAEITLATHETVIMQWGYPE